MKTGRKPYNVELLVERGIFPPNWKEVILDLGRQGKNKLDFAIELKISRNTLYRLMERSEEFMSTINEALSLSEQWFVSKAVERWGEDGAKGLNTTFMKYYIANVYRDSEWKDVEQLIDVKTDGKSINNINEIKVDIIKPKDD